MKKICIVTLGCKVNQYESNSLEKALADKGYNVTQNLEDADAYILNTCAVTNEAERKSRGFIAKIRKVNMTAPIYVCGCSSQNAPEKFEKYEGVKCVFGTSAKYKIIDLIENNKSLISHEISKLYEDNYTARGERTRVVIKIQDGCNNYCSYCLIPFLRGRERSRSFESVEREIKFQSKIAKEVVFTGINLSAYGRDFEEKKSLKDVALLMRKYKNVRFRFSSLEQDIIDEDFLKVLSETENFCPHFHLSLQSGCDRTLKFMNRKYTANQYYKKVQLIRKYFDNPAITTDIIVGFPTETEEDFNESYEFAKKCKFAKIHVFPFSSRSGTVASKLKVVATNVKERVNKLGELDKKMFADYINSNVGKIKTVIIETEEQDYYVGHSENYIKCYIKKENKLKSNQIVKVKILNFYKDGAVCETVSY